MPDQLLAIRLISILLLRLYLMMLLQNLFDLPLLRGRPKVLYLEEALAACRIGRWRSELFHLDDVV